MNLSGLALEKLNSISDRDQLWSPFLHLRPAKDVSITLPHAGQIALYFGLSYGAVYDILSILVKPEINVLHLLLVPILAVPLYGLIFGIFFILPWNRRAARLQSVERQSEPPLAKF